MAATPWVSIILYAFLGAIICFFGYRNIKRTFIAQPAESKEEKGGLTVYFVISLVLLLLLNALVLILHFIRLPIQVLS